MITTLMLRFGRCQLVSLNVIWGVSARRIITPPQISGDDIFGKQRGGVRNGDIAQSPLRTPPRYNHFNYWRLTLIPLTIFRTRPKSRFLDVIRKNISVLFTAFSRNYPGFVG